MSSDNAFDEIKSEGLLQDHRKNRLKSAGRPPSFVLRQKSEETSDTPDTPIEEMEEEKKPMPVPRKMPGLFALVQELQSKQKVDGEKEVEVKPRELPAWMQEIKHRRKSEVNILPPLELPKVSKPAWMVELENKRKSKTEEEMTEPEKKPALLEVSKNSTSTVFKHVENLPVNKEILNTNNKVMTKNSTSTTFKHVENLPVDKEMLNMNSKVVRQNSTSTMFKHIDNLLVNKEILNTHNNVVSTSTVFKHVENLPVDKEMLNINSKVVSTNSTSTVFKHIDNLTVDKEILNTNSKFSVEQSDGKKSQIVHEEIRYSQRDVKPSALLKQVDANLNAYKSQLEKNVDNDKISNVNIQNSTSFKGHKEEASQNSTSKIKHSSSFKYEKNEIGTKIKSVEITDKNILPKDIEQQTTTQESILIPSVVVSRENLKCTEQSSTKTSQGNVIETALEEMLETKYKKEHGANKSILKDALCEPKTSEIVTMKDVLERLAAVETRLKLLENAMNKQKN